MVNGHAERFNHMLGTMIRALPPRAEQKWPQMLQTLTFVYNCTAHESTGYAPFYLMFGRIPRLPGDMMFHNVERDKKCIDEIIKENINLVIPEEGWKVNKLIEIAKDYGIKYNPSEKSITVNQS